MSPRDRDPHPLPGVWGLAMAPITASVASVAFRGSDSNHRSRIWPRRKRARGSGWGAAAVPLQAGSEAAGGSTPLLLALTLEMGAVSTS